jgi:diguanylate cyclase
MLELLSSLLGSILEADMLKAEQSRRLEQAEARAETDQLTGVVNRHGWQRFMVLEEERYRRFGDPGAVVVVDLDGLKHVNDTMGHAAGDRLIQTAATALKRAVREGDLVARLGGDEFGVLFSRSTLEQTEALVARARLALEEAGVDSSIGYAPYSFSGGFQAAWEAADAAMYEDKFRRRRP